MNPDDERLVAALKKSVNADAPRPKNEAAGQKDLMKSNANQELKNSMFENVFGYDQKFLPDRQQQKEEVKGNLAVRPISTPYVAAGYESNPLLADYASESAMNLPEVVLHHVPGMMRASESQESARVIMETRVI